MNSLSISHVYSHNPTLSSCSKTFCQKPIVLNTFGRLHGLTATSLVITTFNTFLIKQNMASGFVWWEVCLSFPSILITQHCPHALRLFVENHLSETHLDDSMAWPLPLLVVTTSNTTVIWSGILFYATLDKCPTAQWYLTKTIDKLERFLRVCSFTAVIKFNC